jgi:hypothetical protein
MALPKNYINFFDVCKLEGVNPNTAKSAIGDGGLEGIKSIAVIKPISHLFREFPKGMRKQYGILRRHYDTWKQTGHVPKVSPGRPPKWTGEEKSINIPAPPFYEQFKAGVAKANSMATQQVTVRQIIYLAMKEYMERHTNIFDVSDNGSNK